MPKKPKAKRLRRAVPVEGLNNEYFGDFAKTINGPPMPSVVVAGALLEKALMTLLHAHFVEDDAVVDSIFDLKGTLDSFTKCTDIAYCVGLIPRPVFDNLKIIAKIRNTFAHSPKIPDFDDDNIIRLCDSLVLPNMEQMRNAMNGIASLAGLPLPEMPSIPSGVPLSVLISSLDQRKRFIIVVAVLLTHLLCVAKGIPRCTQYYVPFIW